jgi:hypothetical protein
MRKLLLAFCVAALVSASALAQSQQAPTLRIVSEDGNRLPSELLYGNTRVKPLRLRPGTNQPITIEDHDFFVQQQYVDFLSRFPDQPGFQFWLGQITGCGTNANCVEGQRINTSGAFFLAIEFQETGFLVYRLHKASFGDLPRYENFMPNTRQVASGVVVNQGDWRAQLDTNKQNFINSWVQGAAFLQEYPAGMAAGAYVDKLIQKAGLTAGDVGRDALVSGLTAGTETRASVLRKIAESAAFSAREKNPAFVLMQYFGYLRRNPNDAPDNNLDGYHFWLQKLNNHGGDFHAAEMVKAFITSGEYRSRFGQP